MGRIWRCGILVRPNRRTIQPANGFLAAHVERGRPDDPGFRALGVDRQRRALMAPRVLRFQLRTADGVSLSALACMPRFGGALVVWLLPQVDVDSGIIRIKPKGQYCRDQLASPRRFDS